MAPRTGTANDQPSVTASHWGSVSSPTNSAVAAAASESETRGVDSGRAVARRQMASV